MKPYFLLLIVLILSLSLAGCRTVDPPKPDAVVVDLPTPDPSPAASFKPTSDPESTNAAQPGGLKVEGKIKKPVIKIDKNERLLTLLDGETEVASCRIGLGFAPEGDKTREGDGRTPIGEYYVCTRNDKSSYYLSLGLSYPSIKDAERGFKEERIDEKTRDEIISAIYDGKRPPWDTPLGGEIMIHGKGSSSDWTLGCIAVENADMDVLFKVCKIGTKVIISE